MSGLLSKVFSIFLVLVFLSGATFAQKHRKKSVETQLLTTNNQPIDQLLERVEDVHITLNRINNLSGSGMNTSQIEKDLPRVEEGLMLIKKDLGNASSTIDVNDLQLYDVMLDAIQESLGNWKQQLVIYEKELVKMNEDMRIFTSSNDTAFKKLAIDTNYRKLFSTEMSGLKEKWVKADSNTKANFKRINVLQARVSSNYFQSIELADKIGLTMKNYWARTLGKEYPFLWQIHEVHATGATETEAVENQQNVFFHFYLHQSGSKWIILLLIALAFFSFVSYEFYKISNQVHDTTYVTHDFKYVNRVPILATLILVLIAGPFLDLTTPSLYLEIMQLGLLVLLGLLYIKTWQRKLWIYWALSASFFIAFTLIDGISDYSRLQRVLLLVLNIAVILFAIRFRKKIRDLPEFHWFVRFILGIFILMNIAAVIFNLFGRMTQADEFSLAAIYALIEIFALNTMVLIFKEFIDLQMIRYQRAVNGKLSLKDSQIKSLLNNAFVIVMALAIFTSLLDNLNILDNAKTQITEIMNSPIKLGSLIFTLGNLLLFIFIIYISNLIQKFLGFFLGDADEDNQDFNKKGSRLAVLRLVLLFLGFLLAVGASGLPLDKITILLGALSVGIGLGLQNIVHNLVSGIILIFERPFKIGDLVEIGTRKGRVKDIGIRSSKLITTEGSEVIVPNGDLLSERVVNWTFNNSNVRTEMQVKIAAGSDIELAKKLITEQLNADETILKRVAPEVFLNTITETGIELKVLVWINNLHQEQTFKSDMLIKIYEVLSKNEIKMI